MAAVETDHAVGELIIGVILQLRDGQNLLLRQGIGRNSGQREELGVDAAAGVVRGDPHDAAVGRNLQGLTGDGVAVDVTAHPVQDRNRFRFSQLESVEEHAAGIVKVIILIAGEQRPVMLTFPSTSTFAVYV